MTTKHERELRKAIDQAGLTIARWDRAGSGNIALLLRAPNGQAQKFFCSPTSGDPHAAKNNAAAFRKFAQANQAKLALPAAAPAQKPRAAQVSTAPSTPSTHPANTPTTMTNAAAKPKYTKNILTQVEFVKLYEWSKTAPIEGVTTYADLARLASVHMGTPVAEGTARNALEAAGRKLELPLNRTPSNAGQRILARELVSLLTQLGHPVADDLAALAKAAA